MYRSDNFFSFRTGLWLIAMMALPLCAHMQSPGFSQVPSAASDEQASRLLSRTSTVRPLVNDIIVVGNETVPTSAILACLTYQPGQPFNPEQSNASLRRMYALGQIRYAEMKGEDLPDGKVNIYIIVVEKKKLREVKYVGNNHLSDKEIKKKIDFAKIHAVDEEELKKYAKIISELYAEKGYHFAKVTPTMELVDNQAVVTFAMEEGKHSVVRKISFTGNKLVSSKSLRSILYTREDWLFNFLDSAGVYHSQMLEADKFGIESFYKNHGYLNAKVVDADVHMDPQTKDFDITFHLEEGAQYKIGDITVPGNDMLSEEELLSYLPIRKGMIYSLAYIQKSLEILRNIWGNKGYINAEVDPSIQPNDETKTVNIAFYTDLGTKVRVNRINIIGNKKTRDYVIRRQIRLKEGDWLTTDEMGATKDRIELLGYFDKRQGANWRMNRISDDMVDLDLILKEVRTGSFSLQASTNGQFTDLENPINALSVTIGYGDINFAGRGIKTDVSVVLSRGEQSGYFNIGHPWLFGKPISGNLNVHASAQTYEDLHAVQQVVRERRVGGSLALGYLFRNPIDMRALFEAGVERFSFGQPPTAFAGMSPLAQAQYQTILNWYFQPGYYPWTNLQFDQDLRNHPMHPSQGYRWLADFRAGIPNNSTNYGYLKIDADAAWYTPLIGTADLILCLHGHFGWVHAISTHSVPYRELYHIGGPATVRGFLFGQIGPMFNTDSIGASKAFWTNIELVFPIRPDFSMKGAVFYDGGAGWDTPVPIPPDSPFLRNNKFNYRQAVGIGLRMLSPVPVQVDWAFKLDRNKKIGESASELHLGMNHNF
jgi:outer membrane protein insertion porin family